MLLTDLITDLGFDGILRRESCERKVNNPIVSERNGNRQLTRPAGYVEQKQKSATL